MKNNGFVYVASVNKQFYNAALHSAQSLLDFYPEAKITLFTHETWVCDEAREIFDQIITDGVPNHIRAKLWALSKSPYDTTLYIDCDTTIQSEEISEVFDLLGDNDIIFTRNRPYNAKITKLSETEEMILNNIENTTKNTTFFISTHRISTSKKCDKIIFLNNGKIESFGTHDELLKEKKSYFSIYSKQTQEKRN